MPFILPAMAAKLGLPLIAKAAGAAAPWIAKMAGGAAPLAAKALGTSAAGAAGKAAAGAAGKAAAGAAAGAAGKAAAGAAGKAAAGAAASAAGKAAAGAAGKAAAGGTNVSRIFDALAFRKTLEDMMAITNRMRSYYVDELPNNEPVFSELKTISRMLRLDKLQGLDYLLNNPWVLNKLLPYARRENFAKWFFLKDYLPELARRGLLPNDLGRQIMGDSYKVSDVYKNGMVNGYSPYVLYSEGNSDETSSSRGFLMMDDDGNVIGQSDDVPGLPAKRYWSGGPPANVRGAGPVVARPFGWAGQDFSDEAMDSFFEDPYAAWSQEAEEFDPFAERKSEHDFMRKEKLMDFALEQRLNDFMQSRINNKLKSYYRKPAVQWLKEIGLSAAGHAAQGAGEIYDAYNSALANSLMNAAANRVTRRQEELYGNPLMSPTIMYAGGRRARGNIANIAGSHLGSFLRGWSDRLAGEFAQQRALRIQMDMKPVGLFMENYYKLGRDIPGDSYSKG